MRVHLYTTDESALRLIEHLAPEDEVVGVVIPENRATSAKVNRLIGGLGRSPAIHKRGQSVADALPRADAGISWLYSQILPNADLAAYPRGILNMHGGRIPEYRGASVLQWAIINGESELGITWHELVEAVDAGPIWAETAIPISAAMTGAELRQAMIEAGIALFPLAWRQFCARAVVPRRPSVGAGRIWPQRRPADGEITPGLSEFRLRNLVRALGDPWPPAWIMVEGNPRDVERVSNEPSRGSIPYKTADGNVVFLQPPMR